MSRILILTDSTSDIDADIREERSIVSVPLNVHFGEESFKDGVDLTPDGFYEKLANNIHHPKTSQPGPEDFRKLYSQFLDGNTDIISIHISSKMSGTVQSAEIAKKMLNTEKVHIVDSGLVSFALGALVLEASSASAMGYDLTDILDMIERVKTQIQTYFVVDTLEYLHKGGRIGKAATLIGGMLHIKPLLTLHDGQVGPYDKLRGIKRALNRMVGLVEKYAGNVNRNDIRMGLAHAGSEGVFNDFIAMVDSAVGLEGSVISDIGPVVGTHAGPGAVGICFFLSQLRKFR